ncbi:MerR family transcriptional regulator [Planotetraspora kaengkrachanensis]|uniref:HTH merR-type domain-containing protein n=1 Tax=Planotetraspora kaengkrachanensis TaxID=575193 RepID=A0A8J3PQ80_9ACTN|nr:MerR family transcriptional regulator [Planotetraspora kaengkrachanensis]GIG77134.1 hypothetical protein Pka01_02610 [Planotetraspora kaengkrachanensis]
MREPWTISELAERAASLLDSAGPVNGRVREVPNERLIRWYTTIGLLDPPLARRGRIALYGRRHLLQLVAVKRRQADGLSIAAIQAELAGATDAMLLRAARLPSPPEVPDLPGASDLPDVPDLPDAPGLPIGRASGNGSTDHSAAGGAGGADRAEAVRGRFWTRQAPDPPSPAVRTPPPAPAAAAATPPAAGSPVMPPPAPFPAASRRGVAADRGAAVAAEPLMTGPDVIRHAPGRSISTGPASADVVYGVRLAPGVTVTLDAAGRPVTSDEALALRQAAEPLLSMLARLGLTDRSDHPEGTTP